MSALVLDAGVFVAVDRGDRRMILRLRAARRKGLQVRTTGAVVAQVWRDPLGRQVELARFLNSIDVRPVDESLGRQGGVLLGRAGASDAVDATLVAICEPGDRLLTSDPDDIRRLVQASRVSVDVVRG